MEMNRILQKNGIFTIVTDNLWYGKFLIKIIAKLQKDKSKFRLKSLCAIDESNNSHNDSYNNNNNINNNGNQSNWKILEQEEEVYLLEGKPGTAAGHMAEASSYFDRYFFLSACLCEFLI